MARVFVSHASQDLALAERMHRWLLDDGHQVFLDRSTTDGIVPGDEWERRLHERLRWADAVACVVTSAFVRSPWCTGEVAVARSRGCRLIPLQAEPATTHPLLGAVQHIDCRHGPEAVRAALAEALRPIDAAGGVGWPDGRSPFPGLRAFAADQHQVFFGRAAEVNELGGLLRSPAERADAAVLLVVGPSGCGKSSLARAGLLPAMAGEPGWWTLPPMLPGTDPEAALVREFAAGFRAVGVEIGIAELRTRLDSHGLATLVDELLHAAPGPRRQRLLLVIDQFEELLTQTDPDQRARFADLLQPLAGGPLRVVGTLRPEFLDPLLVCPELAGLSTRTYTVRPLGRDALPSVIEDPARLAGIAVDPDLVARLVADTDDGAALPLLAYTLAQLAEGVGRGGRLQLARYEQLGGVRGTLTRQADAALAAAETASERSRADILRDLLRLVTVDEHGRPTRWRVPAAELSAAELEPFVTRRLLITENDGDDVVVKVAHEAILSAWAPLARAVEANASALRARRRIEQAADDWSAEGRAPARLWEGGQLASAFTDAGVRTSSVRSGRLVADRVALSSNALKFLGAGRRRDRRRRARSVTVLALLLVVALVGAGLATIQLQNSEEQRRIATARLLVTRAEGALSADPRTALQLGEAAQHLHPDAETGSALVQLIRTSPYIGTLEQGANVRDVAYAPDGRALLSASVDSQVRLWDLSDPGRPRPGGGVGGGFSVAFAPVGHLAAVGSTDGTVQLWELTDLLHPRQVGGPLVGHSGAVNRLAFSPDGRMLATGSEDLTLGLWDVSTPERTERVGDAVSGLPQAATTVRFAPDGRTLATAAYDDGARLWDVDPTSGLTPVGGPLPAKDADVAFVAGGRFLALKGESGIELWDLRNRARPSRGAPLATDVLGAGVLDTSPGGSTLAISGADHSVLLWDVSDPTRPRQVGTPLHGHRDYVLTLAFAPDGRSLATGSGDGTVILWRPDGGLPPPPSGPPLDGFAENVNSVAYAPRQPMLATGSSDGTVVLWDVTDPRLPRRVGAPLPAGRGAMSVAISPDGNTLAAGGFDAMVALWDITDPAAPRRLDGEMSGHRNTVNSVRFSPDGRTLASGGSDGTVLLWNVTETDRPRSREERLIGPDPLIFAVAFAPDGRSLVSTGIRGTVQLWNIADPDRPTVLDTLVEGPTTTITWPVAFSPDGRTLATGIIDGSAALWDLTVPTAPRRDGNPLIGHTKVVYTVAFSPDGRTLATGSDDGTVRLWDLTDPVRVRPLAPALTGHSAGVTSVAFAPDGRSLAAASKDRSALVWDLAEVIDLRDNGLQRACSITSGGLDRDAWARVVPGLPYEDSCSAD
jgi:WD40 repeat protein